MALGAIAEQQLAAWERLAGDLDTDEDPPVLRCGICERGIAVLFDGAARRYLYTGEQMLALKVLHLRNFHPGLGPD